MHEEGTEVSDAGPASSLSSSKDVTPTVHTQSFTSIKDRVPPNGSHKSSKKSNVEVRKPGDGLVKNSQPKTSWHKEQNLDEPSESLIELGKSFGQSTAKKEKKAPADPKHVTAKVESEGSLTPPKTKKKGKKKGQKSERISPKKKGGFRKVLTEPKAEVTEILSSQKTTKRGPPKLKSTFEENIELLRDQLDAALASNAKSKLTSKKSQDNQRNSGRNGSSSPNTISSADLNIVRKLNL